MSEEVIALLLLRISAFDLPLDHPPKKTLKKFDKTLIKTVYENI